MDEELGDHYRDLVEDTRLTRSPHGRLEFLRTQELLRRVLPSPPSEILDIGGGTGVHARWLAQDGYRVHVIDPVPDHVRAAAEIPDVTAGVGDARALPQPDASVDAALLLGPLYHLGDRRDRVTALRECARVLRPGGVLAGAVISRYLSLLETASSGRLDSSISVSVSALVATGAYDGHVGFVSSHWHTADDLRAEILEAGFQSVSVFGVEGPAWPALDAAGLDEFDRLCEGALVGARIVEEDPLMLHASAHLLGVARR